MKPIHITLNPKTLASSLGVLVGLYLLFAFLPLPKAIDTGLDPSWKYGISQLAANGAVFGRDVIFTYGAFGYLVRGAGLSGSFGSNFGEIFAVQILVHVLLFGLAIGRGLRSRHPLEAAAVWISVVFPYLIADFYQALQTEYQILYIIVLLLSFREFWQGKAARYFAIGIGAVGGFLLHSKVSLGLQASVSLFLFFAVRVVLGLAKPEEIRPNLLRLLDSQLAAGTTAFLFLAPSLGAHWLQVAIALLLSLAAGQGIERLTRDGKRPRLAVVAPVLPRLLYGAVLLAIVLTAEPSLLAYLKGYSEITAGYSSAMSYVGDFGELMLAIAEILGLLLLLAWVARDRNASFSAAMLLVILLAFKHGFVRQGAHVLRFFFSMPLIFALCALQVNGNWGRKLAHALHLYSLIVCLISYAHYSDLYAAYYPQNMLRPLTPARVVEKAGYFFNPAKLGADLAAQSQENLAAVTLPAAVRAAIADASVDVIPWETSLVPANDLNWEPRPIFQSQAAYRPYLDFANRDSLAENPRDLLLYNFHAVDGRHPFFDAPATAFHYTCQYEISPRIPAFVQLPELANLMVLEPRSRSRCGEPVSERETTAVWEDWTTFGAEDGAIVRASLEFDYSGLGKLAKSFFRVPPVMVTVRDMDGEERTYKILTGNAPDGVWLSHLPRDDGEAFALFQGQLPTRIYQFKFSTQNPDLFQPQIRVRLWGYDLGEFQAPVSRADANLVESAGNYGRSK